MRSLLVLLLLVVVSACTPMIYGVPQDRWDLMTENERIVAMEAYKERQIAYQQAAAERARIQAEQEAYQLAQQEDERRRRQDRVENIYRGRTGTHGDLLEVTIEGGLVKLDGKRKEYRPVTFALADGEVKSVPIQIANGRVEDLYVTYENRHLWLDTDAYGQNTRRAGHLVYNQNWNEGATYTGINSHGARDMRNITVIVEVLPLRRAYTGFRKPVVIIKEKIVEAPPQIIIKEKIVQSPPQVIIKEKVVVRESNEASSTEQHEHKVRHQEPSGKPDVHTETRQSEDTIRKEGGRKEEGGQPVNDKVVKKLTADIMLNGGQVIIDGQHRPLKPVKFTIAEGETKYIDLASKSSDETVNLSVSYIDGVIYFDGTPLEKDIDKIKTAKKVKTIKSFGNSNLKDVNLRIDYR